MEGSMRVISGVLVIFSVYSMVTQMWPVCKIPDMDILMNIDYALILKNSRIFKLIKSLDKKLSFASYNPKLFIIAC